MQLVLLGTPEGWVAKIDNYCSGLLARPVNFMLGLVNVVAGPVNGRPGYTNRGWKQFQYRAWDT